MLDEPEASDDSVLVGVSTARERSFNKTPALSNIGSMSPTRLSLSTVASPHCRLLFHLAREILTAKQQRLSGAAQNQAAVIAHRGLEVKLLLATSGRGRNIFLDFPFYRSGVSAQVSTSFDSVRIGTFVCNREISVMGMLQQLTRI